MESKFKPFFQVIPVLSEVISTSAYDPTPGLEEEEEEDG